VDLRGFEGGGKGERRGGVFTICCWGRRGKEERSGDGSDRLRGKRKGGAPPCRSERGGEKGKVHDLSVYYNSRKKKRKGRRSRLMFSPFKILGRKRGDRFERANFIR